MDELAAQLERLQAALERISDMGTAYKRLNEAADLLQIQVEALFYRVCELEQEVFSGVAPDDDDDDRAQDAPEDWN